MELINWSSESVLTAERILLVAALVAAVAFLLILITPDERRR